MQDLGLGARKLVLISLPHTYLRPRGFFLDILVESLQLDMTTVDGVKARLSSRGLAGRLPSHTQGQVRLIPNAHLQSYGDYHLTPVYHTLCVIQTCIRSWALTS